MVAQSPKLLQLSGVGDSAILGPLGIRTLIDLKTVGKNLQEQVRILTHVVIVLSNKFCFIISVDDRLSRR